MYYYIKDVSTDPQWNLAAEEYLLKQFDKPVFRLWQNDRSIIIGQHQNAMAEINTEYVNDNKIKVIRRLSGGGAVFHDLGNINFTFIDKRIDNEDSAAMFRRFTLPIIEALQNLGIEAYLEGRNDLLIDGKKFSGNAVAIFKKRVLQHGTLLFDSSMGDLSKALAGRPEKFEGKSVQSNRSRVTNISEHLIKKISTKEFIDYLEDFILNRHKKNNESGFIPYQYSEDDIKAIESLKKSKYSTYEWNFGRSPQYKYSKVKKLSGGLAELYLNIEDGKIAEIKIYGDYFFTLPTNEFEEKMKGVQYSPDAIQEAIKSIETQLYFHNITKEELLTLFFE